VLFTITAGVKFRFRIHIRQCILFYYADDILFSQLCHNEYTYIWEDYDQSIFQVTSPSGVVLGYFMYSYSCLCREEIVK